jgi:hypothetical protein
MGLLAPPARAAPPAHVIDRTRRTSSATPGPQRCQRGSAKPASRRTCSRSARRSVNPHRANSITRAATRSRSHRAHAGKWSSAHISSNAADIAWTASGSNAISGGGKERAIPMRARKKTVPDLDCRSRNHRRDICLPQRPRGDAAGFERFYILIKPSRAHSIG